MRILTWPLPLFDTDMDMDIIKDIGMNEHLHVYELKYEKVHVHVNVMFHLNGGAKSFLGLGSVEVTHPKVLAHKQNALACKLRKVDDKFDLISL